MTHSFDDLYRSYHRRLYGFIYNRVKSHERCEDLLQETMMRAYKSWQLRAEGATFDEWKWFLTIALNVVRNEVRHGSAQKRDAPEDPVEVLREKGWEPASDDDPESATRIRQELGQTREWIGRLPAKMRRALLLHTVHGLKYREVAAVMKISIQTVRSHIYKAREYLRAYRDQDSDGSRE